MKKKHNGTVYLMELIVFPKKGLACRAFNVSHLSRVSYSAQSFLIEQQ